jgi:hypothetical protein
MNLRLVKLRRTGLVAALAAAALAVWAAPAAAAPGFSIAISGPSTATVGKPVLLKVSGKNPPPAEYWFNTYIGVDAIPASVIASCPTEYLEGIQLAESTWASGGDHLAGPQNEPRDAAGNWSIPVGYTPSVGGKMLICAYSQNVQNTLAFTQHAIQVSRAGAGKRCKKPKRGSASAKKCRKRK